MSRNIDPVTLAVIQNGLQQVCNEMDLAFQRSAFSPVIAEAMDRSDGIYHRDNGELDASLRHLAAAIAAWEAMGVAQHPQLAFLDAAYAEVLAAQGETDRAAGHLQGRIEVFDLAFGPDGDESSELRETLDAIQAVGDAG